MGVGVRWSSGYGQDSCTRGCGFQSQQENGWTFFHREQMDSNPEWQVNPLFY